MMAENLAEAIGRFFESSRDPALLEPGEEPYPLRDGSYALDLHGGRLTIQVWDETRNLVRRLSGVHRETPGELELVVAHFGGREGRITLMDRARASVHTERHAGRLVFRERFRRWVSRQFPGWRISDLSSEANLEASLSPSYPRALVRRAATAWAAIAAPPGTGDAAGALTFGLIWLDYLRCREPLLTISGLALFLPEDEARTACLRIGCLNPNAAQYAVYVCSEHGYEQRVDPGDFNNFEARLERCSTGSAELEPDALALVDALCDAPYVERRLRADGGVSLSVRGLEFARASRKQVRFGIDGRRRCTERNLGEARDLARELARMRSAAACDRENPLYRLRPEGWLETELRRNIEQIDATLTPAPVYGQVPALAGIERGVLDLLAVDRSGRLAVIEIKASEDVHLPLQALDYWTRVARHAAAGDFTACGYFPGIPLSREPPRLLLVAPALDFHPKTEALLRYLSPAIEVERIGVGVEWRQGPKVAFRLRGAERPH
ncbi:MAG TPA: hypothetical protein VN428_24095 [Bryobacteraceae bacterium]|nr:hypothetical protein [Bryobacteraceae bacterium]